MILLKNKMGMRVLTLALCAALGGSVLAVKAESVAGETVVQEAVQDENMSENREIDHPAQGEAEPDGQTETGEATEESTDEPTAEPSNEPTTEPTDEPTAEPTEQPTTEPTEQPTTEPTAQPTTEPTAEPSAEPTTEPTQQPTTEPTAEPMPEGAYKITVVSPAKWQKDKAAAKIEHRGCERHGLGEHPNCRGDGKRLADRRGRRRSERKLFGGAAGERDDPCVHYRPCGQRAGEKRSDFLL